MSSYPVLAPTRDNAQLARPKNARPLPITPRVKAAIEHMIEAGADYQTAAATAGLTTHALRVALAKPHIAAFLKTQTHVLLSARRPRNIHRLSEIADADNNMPAVNAIKTMDQMEFGEAAARSSSAPTPGVTVRIVNVVANALPNSADNARSVDAIDET